MECPHKDRSTNVYVYNCNANSELKTNVQNMPTLICPKQSVVIFLTDLVHLTCSSSGMAQEDLAPVVSQLFHVPSIPGEEPSGGKI